MHGLTLKKSKTAEKTQITVQKRVVLAGNPNAGKTTLFNALTKSNLRTGNFHGVTTSPAQKTVGGVTYTEPVSKYAQLSLQYLTLSTR